MTDLAVLQKQISDMIREAGVVGYFVLLDGQPNGEHSIKAIQASSLILDTPNTCFKQEETGFTKRFKSTREVEDFTFAMMLSMCKALALKSDFVFGLIDEDFLISNTDAFLDATK